MRSAEAQNLRAIRDLNMKRVEAKVCRHCAGPLPCWSPSGDVEPGVRHTTKTWKRAQARKEE